MLTQKLYRNRLFISTRGTLVISSCAQAFLI